MRRKTQNKKKQIKQIKQINQTKNKNLFITVNQRKRQQKAITRKRGGLDPPPSEIQPTYYVPQSQIYEDEGINKDRIDIPEAIPVNPNLQSDPVYADFGVIVPEAKASFINPPPTEVKVTEKPLPQGTAESSKEINVCSSSIQISLIGKENFGNYTGDCLKKKNEVIPNGKGTFIIKNELKYEGDFLNGQITGKGTLIFDYNGKSVNRGDMFEGIFDNGNIRDGRYTFKDGTLYEGQIFNNRMNGKGKKIDINGNIADGQWVNNRMNGEGKFTTLDGTVYEGSFKDNKANGRGKLTYQNGKIYEGIWNKGKLTNISKVKNYTRNYIINPTSRFLNKTFKNRNKSESIQPSNQNAEFGDIYSDNHQDFGDIENPSIRPTIIGILGDNSTRQTFTNPPVTVS